MAEVTESASDDAPPTTPPARSYHVEEVAMSQGTQLVMYGLSRLVKSKGCGKGHDGLPGHDAPEGRRWLRHSRGGLSPPPRSCSEH
jgi:hypothetical protein